MSLRQLRARLDRLKAKLPDGDEESMARARMHQLYRKLLAQGWGAHTESEDLEYAYLWMRFRGIEMSRVWREPTKEHLAEEEEELELKRLAWQNSLKRGSGAA